MRYDIVLPFEGNTAKAFDLAAAALASVGFTILGRDDASLEAIGPGMNSTRQSPLLGASHIVLLRGTHDLVLAAELGGVQRMKWFVLLFPIGLCLFLSVALLALFSVILPQQPWLIAALAAPAANLFLWMILGPVMARSIQTRTCRGLDALLWSMAETATAR